MVRHLVVRCINCKAELEKMYNKYCPKCAEIKIPQRHLSDFF